ncbi:hypothetical protein NKI78_32965 [Mesorhizobium sp. M0400]|uniref:hypothetical protein n=1 Tax=Mesorhizobium sp. M0400 TaxID=2956941 RepID=UPI00333C8ACC
MGSMAWEICCILGITRCTAAFPLDNARGKLGVRDQKPVGCASRQFEILASLTFLTYATGQAAPTQSFPFRGIFPSEEALIIQLITPDCYEDFAETCMQGTTCATVS